MIVWRGKGLLVVLALFIGGAVSNLAIYVLQFNATNRVHGFLMGIMFSLFTAATNYLLTKKFVSDEVRYLIDEETGQRIAYRDSSSFMFIPNRYWTWIFLGLSLIPLLVSFIN